MAFYKTAGDMHPLFSLQYKNSVADPKKGTFKKSLSGNFFRETDSKGALVHI